MRIVLLLCTIFTLFSCTGKYHVEGYIKGMTGEDAITVLRQLEGFRYDTVLTVPVCDGHFRFAMPLAIAGEACELQVGTRPWTPFSSPVPPAPGQTTSGNATAPSCKASPPSAKKPCSPPACNP